MKNGKPRVYVETYGCTANQGASEIMLGVLNKKGYDTVDNPKAADIVIVNTCTVKAATEKKILHRLHLLHSKGKSVIVVGCMPEVQKDKVLEACPTAIIGGIDSPPRILDLVEKATTGQKQNGEEKKEKERTVKLLQPRKRFNPVVGIIPVSEGCLGSCSYCIVRRAKGSLFSYPPEAILEEVRHSIEEGCKELWLTSQDNAQYGMERRDYPSFAGLLEGVCALPGDFMVRVGMMNPWSVKRILNPLLEAYEHQKVFKFLHLPVQSGSERVLEHMHRNYTLRDVRDIVSRFRERFPLLYFSTDIIVGYPTETSEDFEKTLTFLRDFRPDLVNISMYTPRPGTPAQRLKNLDTKIVKERSRTVTRLVQEIKKEKNKSLVGREFLVLGEKKSPKGDTIARTPEYRPVVVKGLEPGEWARVEIVDATHSSLVGSLKEKVPSPFQENT